MDNIKRAIVWFRKDLRLHDNEALLEAINSSDEILPIFIFDPRKFEGKTSYGFPKIGKYRSKFTIESVENLRQNLKAKGADLFVGYGKPEEIIAKLAREVRASWVFCNRERTAEEVKVQDALEQNLWEIGQELRYSRGKMLYYTSDLPFPVTHTPNIYSQFRKEVEKYIPIRPPLETPEKIALVSESLDFGEIPTMSDLNKEDFGENNKGTFSWKGGESEALHQLDYYFDEAKLAKTYKKTRNELLGRDFSTKFSPWLSNGCLSPKKVYQKLKEFENSEVKNDSTHHIFLELMWRDFFRLMGKKHGSDIFKVCGTKGDEPVSRDEDMTLFKIWAEGRTGIPFIDANMREINATGFMSNRGRQNVASFLINDLKLNWIIGAEYFESLLLDYDPCSNYGNWNYLAGVGSDPRDNRHFNIISQAKRYDPHGEFVKYWIPELQDLDEHHIHTPYELSEEELDQHGIILGREYPQPILALT